MMFDFMLIFVSGVAAGLLQDTARCTHLFFDVRASVDVDSDGVLRLEGVHRHQVDVREVVRGTPQVERQHQTIGVAKGRVR
ncbi:hypothetical protein C8R46DRAFT_1108327 [Mycena filopes]|nr:hypothetical protein C8R46DRAFT_1108327 [Mycena filopes]